MFSGQTQKTVCFIPSNQGINNEKSGHPIALLNGYSSLLYGDEIQHKDSADLKGFMFSLSQFIQYPVEYWPERTDITAFFDDNNSDELVVDALIVISGSFSSVNK
ncbi:hypothetical protein BpHYR1_040058 [Brachionus plicatilis]|uniref:Uncharacterized protein n=1 Tax=Brachionus plicatilis TaxID=10195 RepID=A0A3M7RWZ0_BRAPC|nr:hypothetical protein BpHYR1_040058 [Brachionus plicatilis]